MTSSRLSWYVGSFRTSSLHLTILLESGETMRAAGLKPIATILTSEAVFISSTTPKKAHLRPVVEQLRSRFTGVVLSSQFVLCQYNIRRECVAAATAITPGRRAATVSPLEEPGWVCVSSMVSRERAACVMDELQGVGAEDIFLTDICNCRA